MSKHNYLYKAAAIVSVLTAAQAWAADTDRDSLSVEIEMSGTVSNGKYAPMWTTANRFGMSGNESKNGYLSAEVGYSRELKHGWRTEIGLELAAGLNTVSDAWIQQAYWDISWNCLNLSIGSRERYGWPLEKNAELTSGWMVEGTNNRPIPQVRGEIKEYWSVPGTAKWLALKGHMAYGYFPDGKWQENFVAPGQKFTRDVLYHSKALMFRLGNKEKFPAEFEFGLMTAAQFGGDLMKKNADGTITLQQDMPDGLKDYWKIFIPGRDSRLANVQGNHCGSWNFGLNLYFDEWRVRGYLEHYFEDHSQMFWQYGRWKDGHIGVEINFPKNRWIETIVWEGLNTTDQTGPILYDDVFSFKDIQMSGCDNYYTNGQYLGWQNYGASFGHPMLLGPEYNLDRSNRIISSRVKAQHLGVTGNPTNEWRWRMLMTYSRNWGTYFEPFDNIKKQFCGMAEVSYSPECLKHWDFKIAVAMDRGTYPGNSAGAMMTVRYKFSK